VSRVSLGGYQGVVRGVDEVHGMAFLAWGKVSRYHARMEKHRIHIITCSVALASWEFGYICTLVNPCIHRLQGLR